MLLLISSLIHLMMNKLIVDTQTQISGIFTFQSQQQDISIWFRAQPSFIREIKVDPPVMFSIINDNDGKILSVFSYILMEKELFIYMEIKKQRLQLFKYVFDTDYTDFTWIRLLIHKSLEMIEYVQVEDQKFILQNLYQNQLNTLYSWQSKLFSCHIYDFVQSILENILILQSDPFLTSQALKIYNFRQQIILSVFVRYQHITGEHNFLIIQDQSWIVQFLFNLKEVMIVFNYGYYKSFTKSFDQDMTDQWLQINIFNELDHLKCQIAFQDKFSEQIVYQKFDNQNQIANQNLFLHFEIFVGKYLQNYKIYLINKNQDSLRVSLDSFCAQNCKICNKLQCLECEGQLSLPNCVCPYYQYLDPSLGICVDKTQSQQISISDIIQPTFCPFGQYQNQENGQCMECPKLNEFSCTSCLYNTDIWQLKRICEFQDVLQQAFILLHTSLFISLQINSKDLKIHNEFNTQYQIKFQDDSRIIVFFKDIYLIMQEFCEKNYFFDRKFYKCSILSKGQQYGYFVDYQYWSLCKIGYILINDQCIKCPKNCLFCKLMQHKLICILPAQSYTINQKQQVIKCKDELFQQFDKQKVIECQIDHCLICYFGSCLICDSGYVSDSGEFCVIGSQYSLFFTIQINDNLIKPQFDYQQMLYLRHQLEKYQLELNYDDILQLIVFGNNYRAMRDYSHKQKIIGFNHDFHLVQCLNQTQYFQFKFCHLPVSGYQYIQQQDKYVYCHNQNCLFDLSFEVVIFFSNKPSISYKNRTYTNFDNFIQSISITDIYIRNTIIKAKVCVFDTPQSQCEHSNFFFIANQPFNNFIVLLDFQGVSNFAHCKNSIRIDIQEVQIFNLFTSSSIHLDINSYKILIKNCSFKNQENILFNLNSRKIYLEQIQIQGIQKNQLNPIFNISQIELLDELIIVDLLIKNISLQEQIIIKIWKEVKVLNISNITLKDNEFKQQSSFIGLQETINLRINYILIDKMIFENSGLILLQTNQPNHLTIINLVFQSSELSRFSVLFESSYIYLINIQFQNVKMQDSLIVFANQNLTIHKMYLLNMNFIKTQILQFEGRYIVIFKFQISHSSINYSDSLIEIYGQKFHMSILHFTNCLYFPNLRLMNIQGSIGIISQLIIRNITNDTYSQQFYIGDNYASDMIVIKANQIQLQFFQFFQLLNPQPLLNIKYNKLEIDMITLDQIEFIQINKYEQFYLIKHLIQIQSNNWENSFCLLQNFKASQILLRNYLKSHLDYLSKLSIINLIGGSVVMIHLYIDNLLSQQQIYILNTFELQMKIENVILDNLQNVGILQFSSSQVQFREIYYRTNHLYQQIVPLFKNDELLSRNSMIRIKDFQLINLSTPLMDIKSSFSFKINLICVNIKLINLLDDIISVQQSNSSFGSLSISKMNIINQLSENQEQLYLVNGNNLKVMIKFLQLRKMNFGVFFCFNNIQFDGKHIYITKGTINQHLFAFQNNLSVVSIRNLIINNITQQRYAIIDFNLRNQLNNNRLYIIVENILAYQYKGETLINYAEKTQNQTRMSLKNIKVEQSYFSYCMFCFNNTFPIQFDIYSLQISKVKCGIFLFTKQKNITINNSIIIDLYSFEILSSQEVYFIQSQLQQTNILNKQTQSQSSVYLDKQLSIQEVFPIALSFHGNSAFKLAKNDKFNQVQFNQEKKVIYVPSGQQLNNFQYFNLQKLDHEQIYDSFSITINSQSVRQNEQIKCSFKQSVDGNYVGNYSNHQEFNLKAGLNTFDDFVFIMNPYQNYSFLQNDIICNNFTLRFDVRILPCQLGEYLHQNKCITCDIDKNLYSIIKKAQYCQILNPEQISEIKVGRIKLNQNYWRPSLTSNLIEKCETEQACGGGWMNGDQSCNSSRVGALCKECDIYNLKGEGQFVQSGQKCLECKPNLLLLLKAFCIFVWVIFITFMNYNTNKKITEKFLQFKIINRTYSDILMRQSIDQFSIIIKIYTNYIFIIYLVQEHLQFLDNKILITLNFISNPGLIITTELDCILVKLLDLDIQYLQLAQSLISPIVILSVAYFIYVMSIALKFQRYHFNLIIIITYSVYLFNQQIIIQNQIKLLSYKIISGIKWIYSNQQFQFYTQKHITMIAIFIAPTTILLLVIPLLIFFLLKFRDKRSIWCVKKYGIIYCDYKQNAYFQEIIRIYSKHIIIFLLYFLNYVDQSILIIFLQIQIYFYEQHKPYALNNLNQLEKVSFQLSVFCLTLLFSLIKQIPFITYTLLTFVNLIFSFKILKLLVICFKRQNKTLIQLFGGRMKEKFPQLKRFYSNKYEIKQKNIQRFILSVSKLQKKMKTSKNDNTQIQFLSNDQLNLIKIGGVIELKSVSVIIPLQEQNQSQ